MEQNNNSTATTEETTPVIREGSFVTPEIQNKYKNRKEIRDKWEANQREIERLQKENEQLSFDNMLYCDEHQWYTEGVEQVPHGDRRKKQKVEVKIGRHHWIEDFKDDATDQIVSIERMEVIKVNDVWQ